MSRLYEAIRATATGDPGVTAFTFLDAAFRETVYTHVRLQEEAERIAKDLRARQLDPRFPLAILFETQEQQVLHYVAALSAGLRPAILTPPNRKLNRAYYVATMEAILRLCRFSAVVTDVAGLTQRCEEPDAEALLEDTAFVQFSSGTTGIKRGVEISHRSVLGQIEAYAAAIGSTREDRIVSWLPLYHDMGFMTALNMALVRGVPVVMMQPGDWVSDPGMYCRAISRYRATLGWNPNFAYQFMAERVREQDLAGADLSSVRAMVNCSEPVTARSQDRFRERFAGHGLRGQVFRGCYAMAETTFALTDGADEGTSVGRALRGVELRVAECTGELWARSPFHMSRYFNNPEATAAVLEDGWLRTGDVGYREGDRFYVRGRKKDVLIVAGENYFPEDLEVAAMGTKGVYAGRVCAFARFEESTQTERAVVLAEADDTSPEVMLAVRQELAARFQLTQFDVHLVPPGWLIKSSAGKMARALNRQKWNGA